MKSRAGAAQVHMEKDSRLRSVLKGITWRCIATLTTYIIALLWTGEASTAGKIAGAEFIIKFGVYYLHERAWQWTPRKNKHGVAESQAAEA